MDTGRRTPPRGTCSRGAAAPSRRAAFSRLVGMFGDRGWSRGAVPVIRLALGVLALLGLFAMHGLGEHGTMHRTVSDASSAAQV